MDRRTIYVDMTTAFEERGRLPHGTTRVERGVVAAFAALDRDDIVFCRYRPFTASFIAVPRTEALAVATAKTRVEARREARAPWRSHPALQFTRRMEHVFRTAIRDPIKSRVTDLLARRESGTGTQAGAIAQPNDAVAGSSPAMFRPGSVLLLPGELQRQDFRVLVELKRRYALDLVFFFYDLLNVLPKGDPRLADPSAVDLPGADFVAREGALLLTISAYSAAALAASCAERGLAVPRQKVVRLGHDLLPGPNMSAVPGLSPGQFVVAVGDLSPRKNFAMLVDVWKEMAGAAAHRGVKLVIVGRIGHAGAPLVARVRADRALAGLVVFLPNAPDEQLRWLYANCRFSAFPSRSEGFGLPVAESLAFGKLCVASNATSIPEASQGLAILLDPEDRTVWRETIGRLLADDALVREQEGRIRTHYRPITWQDTASDVIAAIEVLERR